jgi:hypothetical protein
MISAGTKTEQFETDEDRRGLDQIGFLVIEATLKEI